MFRASRWKVALVTVAALLGLLFTLPNMVPTGALPGWMPSQRLNLGLDLQGGSYLLLEVDTAALARERTTDLIEDVRRELRDARIAYTGLGQANGAVSVRIVDPAQVAAAQRVLGALSQPLPDNPAVQTLRVQTAPDQRVRLAYTPESVENDGRRAVDQSIEIIRRRIDELGTQEPSITRQGATRVVVQAPGESDPERLKNLIGQTARLTFQMVDDTVPLQEAAAGRVPPGSVLLPQEGRPDEPVLLLQRRSLVTGEMLTDAQATFDQNGAAAVSFRFNAQGARAFGRATTANVNKRFAIVLDNRVISAPNIQEPITGGNGQITGNFTVETANDLAILLRAGALPAPLTVEEQRTVGAELGQDAVDAGLLSTALGMVCVVVFMILAYGWLFGGIAIVALTINGLMLLSAMTVTQAALTLPGIAGLILTLAVAVDANVLIYERMRDEVRAGRSPLTAMDAGFNRAIITIFDANITHLGVAAIMFFLGAGPVKGFAWTLFIGVFTSVFTAVMVTQVLLGWWFRAAKPKVLPIA